MSWARADVISLESVYNLRPTQYNVGSEIVELRAGKLAKLSKEERHAYLLKRPVPVVIGPKGEYYMVDRHHLSAALALSGHQKIYITIIADWSDMKKSDFWKRMDSNGYTYLRDEHLNKILPSDLPRSILDLKNDPYRSLAAYAREQRAFNEVDVHFLEFYWAEFYRQYITLDEMKENMPKAAAKAFRISRYKKASHLPGFINVKSCRDLFHK